ncbi:hypothetical protein J6Z48_02245 [bacterium]|nr:hypothetical protein [bacterium]
MNNVNITMFKDPRNLDFISGFIGKSNGAVLSYESKMDDEFEFHFDINNGLFDVSVCRKALSFQVQTNYLSEKLPNYDKVYFDIFRSISSTWSYKAYGCRKNSNGKYDCSLLDLKTLLGEDSEKVAVSSKSLTLPTGKLEWLITTNYIAQFLLLDFVATY